MIKFSLFYLNYSLHLANWSLTYLSHGTSEFEKASSVLNKLHLTAQWPINKLSNIINNYMTKCIKHKHTFVILTV